MPDFSRGQRAKRNWQTWIPSCRECCNIMAKPTIGELRAMVGREVGVTLEGKYRAPFDKALSRLTAPPPTQPRARRRFKIANKRAKHDETRNA